MEGGSGVLFGQDADSKGSWSYDESVGVMFVCFAASRNNVPLRRHALKMADDKTFVLLPADHDVYNEEHIWPTASVTHLNRVVRNLLGTDREHSEQDQADARTQHGGDATVPACTGNKCCNGQRRCEQEGQYNEGAIGRDCHQVHEAKPDNYGCYGNHQAGNTQSCADSFPRIHLQVPGAGSGSAVSRPLVSVLRASSCRTMSSCAERSIR